MDSWQAATAWHRFSELVDAAVEGRPQFVRRRDGREVVVVSREYYEQTRPSLKSVLLSHRFGERGDSFDQALQDAGASMGAAFTPHDLERAGDRTGHQRRK
ncbi:MAG TPA: type II toxin-antitoxin system Phd/YefM family antitoxin [Acetobacteraceae bacterium]